MTGLHLLLFCCVGGALHRADMANNTVVTTMVISVVTTMVTFVVTAVVRFIIGVTYFHRASDFSSSQLLEFF